MIVTATSEDKAQVINYWGAYNGEKYQRITLVGWISQDVSALKTTLYMKWRIVQYGYWPYWLDAHEYEVDFDGETRTWSFNIPKRYYDGEWDATTAKSITVQHNTTTGKYSGTLSTEGYKCWTTFSEDTEVEFPDIAVPSPEPTPEPTPTPDPEPDPPTPLEFDNDPRFYIYADNGNGNELVYSAGVDGYEVLNPKLTLEVNKAGSLTFDIPVGSKMYSGISKLKTTLEARQGNEILFRGRLLNTKRNTLNTISCYCEGLLSWLIDISFQPYMWTGQARDLLKRLIERYNSRATENRKVEYVYSDISAKITLEQKDYSTCWGEIKKVLLSNYGGYIVPYLTPEITGIQWLSTYGATTSQAIQFGENLLDFEEYVDASAVFTAVRAFGKEVNGSRVGLSGNSGFVVDSDAEEMYGRIERLVYIDETTTETALRTAAIEYLRNGVQSAMTLSIKAIDMHLLNLATERIRLGDAVRVVSVPHGVDAYFLCTKIVYDFAHPQNTIFTFGSTQRTISELTDVSYNKYVITEGDSNG